ncbi:hypothetical protein EDB85DRAFT_2152042 [Lactarius pseudohatsudake]|nr:hypothetical protein EDB85DRAFT_2152042 [Lactarius pseudohatsudake]
MVWSLERSRLRQTVIFEVSPQALYKQLLPNMQTFCLRATLATEATKAEEGLSHRLALWRRGYRYPYTAAIQTATNSPSSSLPTEAAMAEEGPSRLAL